MLNAAPRAFRDLRDACPKDLRMTKKSWNKPDLKRMVAGAAEAGGPSPTGDNTQATNKKS